MNSRILFLLITAALVFSPKLQEPKVYNATMIIYSQADPETTVLENTTGAEIVVVRVADGRYQVTADRPIFVPEKTMAMTHYINMSPVNTVMADLQCRDAYYCVLSMFYMDVLGNALQAYDGGSGDRSIPISIKIYP